MSHSSSMVTSFVGRSKALDDIGALLTQSDCRLVTIHGQGGVGKSRLAQRLAAELGDEFRDGGWFVPLQGVDSVETVLPAMVDELKLSLRGEEDLRSQVLMRLQAWHVLVVLDNVEHLLLTTGSNEMTILIEAMLRQAPELKLIVTSRETLNLPAEWVFPLQGLSCPAKRSQPRSEPCESLLLFAERSRQVCVDFSLDDDMAGAIRICRLVDGLPLALELAASWTNILSSSAIADEIEQSLSFLSSAHRNVSERHRSLSAVFEYSWMLLSQGERVALQRLSVFHSGFDRNAAKAVTGVRLSTLATLANKSLLQMQPGGRYQIHELFRQFAESRLLASQSEADAMQQAHSDYYCAFLEQRRDTAVGLDPPSAVREIVEEMQNVRTAWAYAVRMARSAQIAQAAYALFNTYDFQGRYRENRDLFQQATDAFDRFEPTPEMQTVVAELLIYQGWALIRLGQPVPARAVLERSLLLYDQHHEMPPPGFGSDPRNALAIIACIEGDYIEAQTLAKEAGRIAVAEDDPDNHAMAHYSLANAYLGSGEHELARTHAERAYVIARPRSTWFASYCLNTLGEIAIARAMYAEAISHFQASDVMRREIDDLEGMAVARRSLANIAALQKEYERARFLYSQAVALYEEIDDRGGLATALEGLIRVEYALGEIMAELEHGRQALRTVARTQLTSLKLAIVADIGQMFVETEWSPDADSAEKHERAAASPSVIYRVRGEELLALVCNHPESESAVTVRAEAILARSAAQHGSDQDRFSVSPEAADIDMDIDLVIDSLRAELATLAAGHLFGRPIERDIARPPQQDLIEPLTAREIEIVKLFGQGLSNQEIADHLVLSLGTVKWYSSQIYGKLGVRSRTQAVAMCRELGLVV